MQMHRKYRNKKIDTAEGRFDSEKEYSRWVDLKWMQRAGQITDLQRQVTFELLPSQRIDGKVVERPVKYIADFVYMQNGEKVVEDVKGLKLPEYVLKRKLMLYIHNLRIKEI